MTLEELGWSPFFEDQARLLARPSLRPARVTTVLRGLILVRDQEREWPATLPGGFRHRNESEAEYPITGDWLLVEQLPREEKVVIRATLTRKTVLSRTAAGRTLDQQVLAANVDNVFVTAALSIELNLRRIERYLTAAWDSEATAVVLLTKVDLCEDLPLAISKVESVAAGAEIITVSSISGSGLQHLSRWLKPGTTSTLIGPSGVGKSTLINALCEDDILDVQPVRDKDDKGRHTTTRRELIQLPGGALLIDTPGLRELQLWEGQGGLPDSFADIELLATQCRFSNCRHTSEPSCAVRAAIASGTLIDARYQSFQKLQAEIVQFEVKRDARAQSDQRRKVKQLTKNLQNRLREKGRID